MRTSASTNTSSSGSLKHEAWIQPRQYVFSLSFTSNQGVTVNTCYSRVPVASEIIADKDPAIDRMDQWWARIFVNVGSTLALL